MGFEYVWETEHHFLEKFSYSSAPELFLTAVAQNTSKIRIGHGAVLLTMNHPVRVAERAAVLDILSDGRLEFGTARGVTEAELGGFMIEPEDSRPMWEEALRMIPPMWMNDRFEWNGKFFKVPPRNVIPKPVQQPHPPLWVAATTPPTFEMAGHMGLGVLSFALTAPGQSEKAVVAYRAAIRNAEPVGAFANNQVAAFTTALCLEDDTEARRVGIVFRRRIRRGFAPDLYPVEQIRNRVEGMVRPRNADRGRDHPRSDGQAVRRRRGLRRRPGALHPHHQALGGVGRGSDHVPDPGRPHPARNRDGEHQELWQVRDSILQEAGGRAGSAGFGSEFLTRRGRSSS